MARQLFYLLITLIIIGACTPPPPPNRTVETTSEGSPSTSTLETPTPSTAIPRPRTPTPTANPSPTPDSEARRKNLITPSITTLELWQSLPQAQEQQLKTEIDTFEESFPEYRILLRRYDNPENFMAPLLTEEISFDIALVSPPLLGSLWRAEQITPISDLFPPSFLDSFAAPTMQGAQQEGELWALPDTTGFHLLLFYNREVVDTPPTTLAELDDLIARLREEEDISHPLALNSYDPLWLLPWIEGEFPAFSPEAILQALELYQAWHEESEPTTYQEARDLFLSGQAPMLIDGEWAITELAPLSHLDWGVARLPEPASPLILSRYWGVSPHLSGDQTLAAADFLDFITQPERQLTWAARFGLLPTRRDLQITDPHLRISIAQMITSQPVPLGLNLNPMLNGMRDPLQQMLTEDITPAQAAQRISRQLPER